MIEQPTGRQNGFSLVEILIATMILTVGVLAMAASTGYVSGQLKSSIFDTQRIHAKEQIVEELRATRYSSVINSSAARSVGRFSITWTVWTPTSNTKRVQLVTSGPAYRGRSATTAVDTINFDILAP